MIFALGYIVGLATAALVFTILAFFRAGIESRVKVIEVALKNAGPQPRGSIFIPEDEATIVRQAHIEKNKREGRDTPISELE